MTPDLFTLEVQTDEQISAEERRTHGRAPLADRAARRLTGDAGEIGTPDLLDPTAGPAPLFNQPHQEPTNQPDRPTMQAIVERLKQEGQDFEFYPTTDEILKKLVAVIKRGNDDYSGGYRGKSSRNDSFLDIGAGNGKVLRHIKAAELGFREFYAIEKSPILTGQLEPHVFVIGTAFEEQSLFSKKVDVIFSNPPYSIFEEWAVKIIREAAAERIFLVLPQRWEKSVKIKDALKFRGVLMPKDPEPPVDEEIRRYCPKADRLKICGDFDFEDAEDRAARAKVHLLLIEFHKREENRDPFAAFFNEQFGPLIEKFKGIEDLEKEENRQGETTATRGGRRRSFQSLVVGADYPTALVNLYMSEMSNIQRNYELVAELDPLLLREFEISPAKIMSCLKARLTGLRMDYWKELFSRMRPITDRLTSRSRGNLLDTLNNRADVDFTVANIHAVLVWAIKNANDFINSQLITTYESMVDKCNVVLYKSNHRQFVQSGWRYNKEDKENTHYALDYRIVMHSCGGIANSDYSWRSADGLEERAHEFLRDLLTVANNLGFLTDTSPGPLSFTREIQWRSNSPHTFYFQKDGEDHELFEARAFKKGNMHLRLSKKFALALNVEHGRLKGWLRSKEEAATELQEPEAAQFFKVNHAFLPAGPTVLCLN